MRRMRTTLIGLAGLATVAWLTVALVASEQVTSTPVAPHQMPMAGTNGMTKDQKIANAMTAAPASVSAKATVLDWPAKEGDAPAVIRAGNNGWSCLPDMPDTQGLDPMCLDQSWMLWVDAYVSHKSPTIKTVGIGYMIAPGGAWGSNTDPYAMAATPDNRWHIAPPHLMILTPDLASLAGLSTDPNNGGPYVMYAGTPYAHIMAPIAAATPAGRSTR